MAEATLKDVARAANVHVGTASRALDPARSHLVNEVTKQRVLTAATELGYKVNAMARGLRKGSSGLIGVVVGDVGNPFLPPILRGIEQELGPRGFMTVVAETHENSDVLQSTCEQLLALRVDAIVISAAHLGDEPFVTELEKLVPVVLGVRRVNGAGHHIVTHDDVLGARLATSHLVDCGHRQLAQLRGPLDVSSFSGRAEGFQQIVAERGCEDVSIDVVADEPTTAEGKRLAEQLLARTRNRPTAIFAHNDSMAVGALEALADVGLSCPRDVSIVGYNDAPLTEHLEPALSTVRLPSHALGRRTAALVLGLLSGEAEPPSTVQLQPELIIRGSTSSRVPLAAAEPAGA
ncbi:LacI family DNA-binding transcriptional regulator [Rhodococcus sp. NPDC057014]|uniref:LacI family DNA-binding transcriptional regulator n=1 Tax=Rhodococcus sp. NPDC057014 TaxID=3346000 RepID=UPI00363D913D